MKVIFIQPAQFLRSKDKTNPYFDPIIKCAGEDWTVWLPRGEECGYPADHVRRYGRIIFWSTWFWRAVHIVCPWLSVSRVYWLFGKLARPFLRDWAKADIIITITGIFADELAGAFPDKRIVDVQHGVIYSRHNGYFCSNGEVLQQYRDAENRFFWVYGKGYADCFFKNPENAKSLEGRVKIIGDVVRANCMNNVEVRMKNEECGDEGKNIIAFSSQLTRDLDDATLKLMVERMVKFFEKKHAQYGDKCRYVIKQHPRFNNVCDISALKALSYLEHSAEPWSELFPKMKLHATFSSTVCFDAASAGVPTEFVPFEECLILDGRYYTVDYGYPGTNSSREQIFAWYQSCYSPFSKENCLKMLKGSI